MQSRYTLNTARNMTVLLQRILISNPRKTHELIELALANWDGDHLNPAIEYIETLVEENLLDIDAYCCFILLARDLSLITQEKMKELLTWLEQPENHKKFSPILGCIRLADQLSRHDLPMDIEKILKFSAGSYLNLPQILIVGKNLANVSLSACLDNSTISNSNFDEACLLGCSFKKVYIEENSSFQYTDFSFVKICDANIYSSNFKGGIFKGSNLKNTRFTDCNAEFIDFTDAYLIDVQFSASTKLAGAIFQGATFMDLEQLFDKSLDLPEVIERVQSILDKFNWVLLHPQKNILQQAILADLERQTDLFSHEIKLAILLAADTHPNFAKDAPSVKSKSLSSSRYGLMAPPNSLSDISDEIGAEFILDK